jgi:uncharacterized lipoprotein YbaY
MAISSPLVRCVVVLDEAAGSFGAATLFVRLDDVTLADRPSTPLAQAQIDQVAHRQGSQSRWVVQLGGAAAQPQHRYSIWAHLDIDGDGQVSRGDYITMQSYPVLTFGCPAEATVHLRLVT